MRLLWWLRLVVTFSQPVGGDIWTLFMCVDDGLDAVEPDAIATRQRLARRASGRQRNAGPDHGSGL